MKPITGRPVAKIDWSCLADVATDSFGDEGGRERGCRGERVAVQGGCVGGTAKQQR
jgi:hypothetical protein